MVSCLFSFDSMIIKNTVENLINRLQKKTEKNQRDKLIFKLQREFPYDIGILFSYLLNYIILQPGQCIQLNANEPHAYLNGDCIECILIILSK